MGIIEGLFNPIDSEVIASGNSEIIRQKILYCESLFERFGKGNNYSLKCNNKYLSSFYNSQFNKFYDILVNKYPTKYIHRNFMAECASFTYEAVCGFNILDGGNWQGIIDGTDKANTKRLVKHIIQTVRFNILREIVNDDKLYTRREVNGKKEQHVTISLNVVSLDNVTLGHDGEETTFEKLVSSEQNFIYEKDGIKWSFYLDWLEKNKCRLLSKTQQKYLEVGIYERKMHNRIQERLCRALERENPFGKKTVLQLQKEQEIQFWTGLMDIIYNEQYEYSVQNERISDWIIENIDDDRVSSIIYDKLSANDIREVVFAYQNGLKIPSDTLYKLYEAIEDRLDQLAVLDTRSIKFHKKESEYGIGHWTLEKHQKYAEQLKQFKKQKFNKPTISNRLVVTPTGLEIPKEIE